MRKPTKELYSRECSRLDFSQMSLENAELTKSPSILLSPRKLLLQYACRDLRKTSRRKYRCGYKCARADTRIGRKYLTGALGYGGPCFPRDNVALTFIAKELGVEARLAETTDSMNRSVAARVVEKIRPMIKDGATVAVLGLSYKPFSHVTEESQGIYIADALSKAGARVVGYDPLQ